METEIGPQTLLKEFKKIERELGRKPGVRWGPRIVDLDILLYGDRIVNDHNLKIPHERMHERAFVLEPLCEISPDIKHPVLRVNISELLEKLRMADSSKDQDVIIRLINTLLKHLYHLS